MGVTNKDQCREAFEAWARSLPEGVNLTREGSGYRYAYAECFWEAWQAARSAPAAPVELPEPVLFVSAGQLGTHTDPGAYGVHGSYLPARKTAAGLFTAGLYTEQQVRELLSEAGTVLPETPESPPKSAETRMDASSDRGPGVLPEDAIDLPWAGAEALKEYLQFCKEHSIQPDVGGAFAYAIRAGAEIAAVPKLPQGDGWIPVGEQLPESGKPVLLDIGKKYPIRAMWAARFTLEADDEDPDWGEWNEDGDMYYCPEGWYEWNEHEETHWRVSVEPLRWMPLPQPPKEQG